MSDFDAKTDAFKEFIKEKNITVSPKVQIVDLREQNQGRGMVAIEDIDEDEVLFSIPQTSVLRFEHDKEFMKLVEKYELDVWSALIVKMMACFSGSEWKPYFDILPTEFNTPMFWSEEEQKSLLQGSEVISKIDREGADAVFDDLSKGILFEPCFASIAKSRELFHRMGSLIMAYGFDVPLKIDPENEEDGGKAMVPVADLLNSHTKLQNARLTLPETEGAGFDMVASKPIAKGEQIYNIYGNQPSSDMLRRYGFVEAGGTDFEVVEIDLELVKKTAAAYLNMKPKELNQFLRKRVESYVELSDLFEIGLTMEDDISRVEMDPELMLLANCLTVKGEYKRAQFKEAVSKSEDECVTSDAADLIQMIIDSRKGLYPEPVPEPSCSPENAANHVYLSKQDMAAQVLQSELKVLEMASDWASSFQENPRKKVRKD